VKTARQAKFRTERIRLSNLHKERNHDRILIANLRSTGEVALLYLPPGPTFLTGIRRAEEARHLIGNGRPHLALNAVRQLLNQFSLPDLNH
jgi:hypothetical protein